MNEPTTTYDPFDTSKDPFHIANRKFLLELQEGMPIGTYVIVSRRCCPKRFAKVLKYCDQMVDVSCECGQIHTVLIEQIKPEKLLVTVSRSHDSPSK